MAKNNCYHKLVLEVFMYNDYYNYLNNNCNLPIYNQPKGKSLFNPYQGFIRGNMFPDLYNF